MIQGLNIRPSRPSDRPMIEALYRDAFPNEDLLPLLEDLLTIGDAVMSWVGESDVRLVGHVAVTRCHVDGFAIGAALLGPLAVAPRLQRRGIGQALVRAGLAELATQRMDLVFVLGDPDYYARFGFVCETRIAPPYPLVEQWRSGWQSLRLSPEPSGDSSGTLRVPEPWLRPALWAP